MSHHLPIAGSKDEPLYAIGARFDTPEALVGAGERLRSEGITSYECFTPYPVHGLAESMRLPKFAWDLFAREASRGFFLAVEARDKKFSTAGLSDLLHDLSAGNVTAIHLEAPEPPQGN